MDRLHSVLRPFLLRRLKSEVEKQMPGKHEHVVRCRLSKRQRTLYEEYMASSDTRETLASGNFLGIINVLMSLRKVRPTSFVYEHEEKAGRQARELFSQSNCTLTQVLMPLFPWQHWLGVGREWS